MTEYESSIHMDEGGGKSYRLCNWITGHPLVVLRDSDSSRCGCLAIVEETEFGAVGRICIPDPC